MQLESGLGFVLGLGLGLGIWFGFNYFFKEIITFLRFPIFPARASVFLGCGTLFLLPNNYVTVITKQYNIATP